MTTLKQLKAKYSGQEVPQWELDALEKPAEAEAPKRRGRPPNAVKTEEVNDEQP